MGRSRYKIIEKGSSGNWLVDMAAKDIMQSKYILLPMAQVVEAVLGDSLKVIINCGQIFYLGTMGAPFILKIETKYLIVA